MKFHQAHLQRNLMLTGLSAMLLFSCQKDYTPSTATDSASSAATASGSFTSDKTITVETSILPPVTPQSFIANGNTSLAAFQITTSQSATINQGYFKGTFPAIQYITSQDLGVAFSHNGQMGFTGIGILPAGAGMTLPVEVHYAPVDSAASGMTAQLSFTGLSYETNDGLSHDFTPTTAIRAQAMCLVNNIPHILFRDPIASTINTDYHQVARIELTGDTNWVLNSLPLMLSAPTVANIPESQLILKSSGQTVKTNSGLIQLSTNSRAQTVINFTGGFKHLAGQKEILNVYAKTPTIGMGNNPITTTMYPLSSFVWTDGLGAKIAGGKNDKFYKEQTGQSTFYQQ